MIKKRRFSFIFYLRPLVDLLIYCMYLNYFFPTINFKLLGLYSCLNIAFFKQFVHDIIVSFFFKNITRIPFFGFNSIKNIFETFF